MPLPMPPASTPAAEMERLVDEVELRLAALALAVHGRDSHAIELQASELHLSLTRAVEGFMHAARHGGVPERMRRRLARASASVASQRESLARATAALDRAIEVLMPAPVADPLYSASGLPGSSGRRGGVLRA